MASRWDRRTAWLCVCFAIATAIYPLARACLRMEVNYNEGWNVYNASLVAQHHLLYAAKPAWTTVNYPMLSFTLVSLLHCVTHDYLFTGRALSVLGLVGTSVLVGAIVRLLQRTTGRDRQSSLRAAVLAGFFCVAVFCTTADQYVGMDDPQMLAHAFFVGGLLVYLWRRDSLAAIAGAALLFVVGGSIKHNPIDVPLAVLIDLALIARWRALWFAGCGIVFAAMAGWLNVHFGGPFFVDQLLAPRSYLPAKALENLVDVFGPLLLPLCAAVLMALTVVLDRRRRVAAILLGCSLLVGGYFGGGRGVSINALFSAMLAMTILVGMFWDEARTGRWPWLERRAAVVPFVLFAWLAIPWMLVPAIVTGHWNPMERLRNDAAAAERFEGETEFLHDQAGPVLCESLLRCYFADKPYVYDPFNATRLIELHRLDGGAMVEALREQQYGAVQFDEPIERERHSDRFDPAIVRAIEENYMPAAINTDGEIYVPRNAP